MLNQLTSEIGALVNGNTKREIGSIPGEVASEFEGTTGNSKRDVKSDALNLVNAALSKGIITPAEASAYTDMIK